MDHPFGKQSLSSETTFTHHSNHPRSKFLSSPFANPCSLVHRCTRSIPNSRKSCTAQSSRSASRRAQSITPIQSISQQHRGITSKRSTKTNLPRSFSSQHTEVQNGWWGKGGGGAPTYTNRRHNVQNTFENPRQKWVKSFFSSSSDFAVFLL